MALYSTLSEPFQTRVWIKSALCTAVTGDDSLTPSLSNI